jgi:hypothetical protein
MMIENTNNSARGNVSRDVVKKIHHRRVSSVGGGGTSVGDGIQREQNFTQVRASIEKKSMASG